MKFKGNFGVLTLQINGTEATGTYQENGTLKGEFINNTFKGQWENKGMEGLVEFTITDDKLEGNWKKGLEPGTMKGKWIGEIVEDNYEQSEGDNRYNVDSLKEAFPEANEFFIRLNTDHWILIEEGWDPVAAVLHFTINKKGELLSWSAYDDEVIPYLEIPDSWHEMKRICSGSIEVDNNQREIEEIKLNDEEGFYNLCCEILEFVKEQ